MRLFLPKLSWVLPSRNYPTVQCKDPKQIQALHRWGSNLGFESACSQLLHIRVRHDKSMMGQCMLHLAGNLKWMPVCMLKMPLELGHDVWGTYLGVDVFLLPRNQSSYLQPEALSAGAGAWHWYTTFQQTDRHLSTATTLFMTISERGPCWLQVIELEACVVKGIMHIQHQHKFPDSDEGQRRCEGSTRWQLLRTWH